MQLLSGVFKYGSLDVVKIGNICQFSCCIKCSGTNEVLMAPDGFRPRATIAHMASFNSPNVGFTSEAFVSFANNGIVSVVTNDLSEADYWVSFAYIASS